MDPEVRCPVHKIPPPDTFLIHINTIQILRPISVNYVPIAMWYGRDGTGFESQTPNFATSAEKRIPSNTELQTVVKVP